MRKIWTTNALLAFSIISIAFTFLPESLFGKPKWYISELIVKEFALLSNYYSEVNALISRIVLYIFIFISVSLAHILYLALRRKVLIKGNNYQIVIEYGDLFKCRNCKKVISFDECYSTNVGNGPADVKPNSICGQFLKVSGNLNIDSLLHNANVMPEVSRSKFQDKVRYKSGTIVPNGDYLLMAFAKLDEKGLGRFFSRDEFIDCLAFLWKEINTYYGQKDVCMPILGSGITRFESASGDSLTQQELLDIIIMSYKLSSHKIKLPCKLHIICRKCNNFSIIKRPPAKAGGVILRLKVALFG